MSPLLPAGALQSLEGDIRHLPTLLLVCLIQGSGENPSRTRQRLAALFLLSCNWPPESLLARGALKASERLEVVVSSLRLNILWLSTYPGVGYSKLIALYTVAPQA